MYNTIIYYLTINFFIFFLREHYYNSFNLKTTRIAFILRLIIISIFFISFIIFFRLLGFFIYREPFDKKLIVMLLIILLALHFIIKIYKCIIFFFKYNFMKQHLFFINCNRYKYYKQYLSFIIILTCLNAKIGYFFFSKKINVFKYNKYIYFFFKYFLDLILLILLCVDFFFFEKILIISTVFFPYYGLYKFLFNLNSFFNYKLDLHFDLLVSEIIYNEDLKKNLIFKPYNYSIKMEYEEKYFFLKKYIHCIILDDYII